MNSYINQNDLTDFDASCSSIWKALTMLQGPCLEGRACFVDVVTEEQENQSDNAPPTPPSSSLVTSPLGIGLN